ncbi:cytochrome-c oxidase, cbb3-type subunit III [Poseidonocella sp. HB161398]|uniref:cytochrome-c oxidase, cbb3-type subunit III n=1 Tax=Poseidonocella sp. HB161398 TaxID=2320855 RepID=UPI001107C51A|nr:cytochrome-c oxidase, cbb3-type subunit III [Poseidonocella sp. HB161398]
MSNHSDKTHQGDVPTTGHSWDGIEEYDNPMPRWWLIVFYICIGWGAVYTLLMPSWPGLTGAWPGLLGFSTRGQVAEEMARFSEANAAIDAELAQTDLAAIVSDPELNGYAVNAGAAVFRTWCAQCHGSGAAGAVGFPSLLDDDWLWGGDLESIHYTVTHGIRNETDDEARYSEMPVFGEMLNASEIAALANYVMSLSGEPQDASLVEQGSQLFADNCVACHQEGGVGDRSVGAPNLSDAIWLYGGDYDSIVESITYARFGVMPNWNARLTESQIRAVTAYVHGLGGGE